MKIAAFACPYFGKLPDYFRFWARSCEANHPAFHFFVYNDQCATPQAVNSAVTLAPYTQEQLRLDARARLGYEIPAFPSRKLCDLRLLFYGLRRAEEGYDQHPFFGYCDLDIVFGQISAFLPPDLGQCSMVSAHDGRPCGPFTLIRSSLLPGFYAEAGFKSAMVSAKYQKLDESAHLLQLAAAHGQTRCASHPLQPSRTGFLEKARCVGLWREGELTVSDGKNSRSAALFHFTKLKVSRSFQVFPEDAAASQWRIDRHGIRQSDRRQALSWLRRLKERFSPPTPS
jgi:hypothetical protein